MPSKKKSQDFMQKALNDKFNQIVLKPQKYPVESQWIAPPESRGVKYISFLGSTGYADAAKNYIRSLVELGIYVYFEPIRCFGGKSGDLLSEDDLVLAICLGNKHIKYDTVIIHAIPHYWHDLVVKERGLNPQVKVYGLTVWETDRVYPKWLNIINNVRLDGLILPSNWNKKTFEDSAKAIGLVNFPPVYSCHHVIIDRPVQKNLTRANLYGNKIRLAFLCIGTWTPRKGISETIEAYLQAFKGQPDVTLYLKTNSGSYSKKDGLILRQRLEKIMSNYENSPQIILDTELRSDDYIESLTENCDVYLSLCNSEGVGLGACSAALKGKIIIMTGYGGQTEYIQNACWIEYKLGVVQVPPNFAEWIRPPQKWAYPSMDHAMRSMQNVYNNLKNYKNEASINRSIILKNYSYTAIGQKLVSIINCHFPQRLQKPIGQISESESTRRSQQTKGQGVESGSSSENENENENETRKQLVSYQWKPGKLNKHNLPSTSTSTPSGVLYRRESSTGAFLNNAHDMSSNDDERSIENDNQISSKKKIKKEKHSSDDESKSESEDSSLETEQKIGQKKKIKKNKQSKEYRELIKERHRLRRQRHLERRLYKKVD